MTIKKRVCSIDIKIFNSLPQSITNLSDNLTQFKSVLKNYFISTH